MKIIDGRALAERIKDGIAHEVFALGGEHPMLAIILVGTRPDSEMYVRIKSQEAEKVGIDTSLYRLEETASPDELLAAIKFLNQDPETDGILVQLPLPEQFDADAIVAAIDPAKDVDGFAPENLQHLQEIDDPDRILPPVFLAVLNSYGATGEDWEDKQVSIVAKPGIFAGKLAELLAALGARAVILAPDTPHLAALTNLSDVIITLIGKPGLIKQEYIKPGAVIIDIGISQDAAGRTAGDLDADEAGQAAWITPVPGGIGPQTVAFALKNTLDCFNRQHKI